MAGNHLEKAPRLVPFDASNSPKINSIVGGDYRQGARVSANCQNINFTEFRHWMLFAAENCSMSAFVCMIITATVPSEIDQMVILPVAIIMTSLLSIAWLSNKRQEDNAVHVMVCGDIVAPQVDEMVAGFHHKRAQDAPANPLFSPIALNSDTRLRADASECGRGIQAVISRYWLPIFIHRALRRVEHGQF